MWLQLPRPRTSRIIGMYDLQNGIKALFKPGLKVYEKFYTIGPFNIFLFF